MINMKQSQRILTELTLHLVKLLTQCQDNHTLVIRMTIHIFSYIMYFFSSVQNRITLISFNVTAASIVDVLDVFQTRNIYFANQL